MTLIPAPELAAALPQPPSHDSSAATLSRKVRRRTVAIAARVWQDTPVNQSSVPLQQNAWDSGGTVTNFVEKTERQEATYQLAHRLRDTDLDGLRPGANRDGWTKDEATAWDRYWADVRAAAKAPAPPRAVGPGQ